jgi:molecular chaperone DnaK (HSP70)
MRLGIDFGTTRIVAAAVDRGNYPVVSFEVGEGGTRDWFPPLVAVERGARRYGWDAWSCQADPEATVVRSLKRFLAAAGPDTIVQIAGQALPMHALLAEMTAALREALVSTSTLNVSRDEPLEVMLGVPANANSNQRFLTVEAFRAAGFEVLGLLNEPSAASIEFSHRSRTATQSKQSGHVLVYDLGGGTFDASLVEMDERTHSLIGTEGISTLGGDDFDEVLAELALDAAGVSREERDSLSQAEHFRLHEECREKKEALSPNARRMTVDLEAVRPGWGEPAVAVATFFEGCRPLIDETLHALEDLLQAHGFAPDGSPAEGSPHRRSLEAVYVTGGGSELPLVARGLRERFGRRVRRAAQARAATAIGLAIQADIQAGYVVRERFTRWFGVWREAEGGSRVTFDPLFEKGTPLPGPDEPPLLRQRAYNPVHNLGHLRYLECTQVAGDGQPTGDITVWDEIRFPFDPALAGVDDLAGVPVLYSDRAREQWVEERYSCGPSGAVAVAISSQPSGLGRTYTLGRWAAKEVIRPGRARRRPAPKGRRQARPTEDNAT